MTTEINFASSVHEGILAVEGLMRAQAFGHHPDLGAALELLLSSGGKRIRPVMTLLVGSMFGAQQERLVTLAAAIELLHTATLVHDDLIDSSLLRRGMPTLNSKWSPGATVLTGDFLFASAAKLAADTQSIPVMTLFSKTLTIIVNGEINQLFNSRCSTNLQDYYKRIYDKTASLFETSAKSAALISPATEKTIDHVRQYGYEVGMAFQIVDDILDFTGEMTRLGKPVGGDLRQGIITLPVLEFLRINPNHAFSQQLAQGKCPSSDQQTNQIVAEICASDAINTSMAIARGFIDRALTHLNPLPESPQRTYLKDLAEFIVRREL